MLSYSRHTITGFAGRVPTGHHATLAMPTRKERLRIAVSPLRFSGGLTRIVSAIQSKAESIVVTGYEVDRPDPSSGRLPGVAQRRPHAATRAVFGHADLVQLVNETTNPTRVRAWTTATFPTDDGLPLVFVKRPERLKQAR